MGRRFVLHSFPCPYLGLPHRLSPVTTITRWISPSIHSCGSKLTVWGQGGISSRRPSASTPLPARGNQSLPCRPCCLITDTCPPPSTSQPPWKGAPGLGSTETGDASRGPGWDQGLPLPHRHAPITPISRDQSISRDQNKIVSSKISLALICFSSHGLIELEISSNIKDSGKAPCSSKEVPPWGGGCRCRLGGPAAPCLQQSPCHTSRGGHSPTPG